MNVRRAIVLALLSTVGACDPALASRAFVGRDAGRAHTVQIVAAAGERNDVVVTEGSDAVHISDGAGIEAGPGCHKQSRNAVECDLSGHLVARLTTGDLADRVLLRRLQLAWRVDTGEGADVFEAAGAIHEVHGGAGDDLLIGAAAGLSNLWGDEGADDLRARGGGTNLHGGPGDDRLQAPAKSRGESTHLDGGPGADAFLGGEDAQVTVSYSTRTAPVSVDFDGEADDGEAQEGDLVGLGVDYVAGGGGDDTISGRDTRETDTLVGNGGSDVLTGGGGPDVLDGGDGDDVLTGGDGPDQLGAGLGADELQGQGGDDALSTGEDFRVGGGWSGADRFSGGDGRDSVSYERTGEGVSVDLEGDADDGPAGKGDTVMGDIEEVVGSYYDDRLTGSAGNDLLVPILGQDVVEAGPGDDVVEVARGPLSQFHRVPRIAPESVIDIIDGGTGSDTVDYSDAGPARVDLGGAGRNGSDTQPQELRGIENLIGSDHSDGFIAGPGPNAIRTGRGDDSVVARPGDGDTIDCGGGTDAAEIGPNTAATACELVQLRAAGPSAFADVKPLRRDAEFARLYVVFSESWVGARLRLTERPSGRRVSEWRVVRRTDRRLVRVELGLTRHARRAVRGRKRLRCILTVRMRDLAGSTSTERIRAELRLRR